MLVHIVLFRTLPIGCSMYNLLRCRRGTAAFATVIALVPLIGVVALGGEAGSWYVTKQHAQNAADTAAYSGALRLACSRGSVACTDMPAICSTIPECVAYRGKQFAAKNGFSDGANGPDGTTQSIGVDIGNYAEPTW